MRSIMVISTKGGPGKTTLAINIALELSKNYRTALIDLDIDSSNEAGLLGLQGDIEIDLSKRKMIPRDYGVNGKTMKVFAMSLYLKQADEGITMSDSQRQQFVREAILNTEYGDLDYRVYDMPGGTSVEFMSLIKFVPDCAAVVITQPNTTEDLNRTIDVLQHFKIPIIGVVENMSGSWMHGAPVLCSCGCGKEFAPFGKDTVQERYPELPFSGRIPLCEEIYETQPPTIPAEFGVIENIIKAVL